MYKVIYTIPISGTQGVNQLASERIRVGNVYYGARQQVIYTTNTDAGVIKTEVKFGIDTFTKLTNSSYTSFLLTNSQTAPVTVPTQSPNDNSTKAASTAYVDARFVAWADYSGTSTITGWASFTTQQLQYSKVGDVLFVFFCLIGTSNATTTSFTIPYTANAACLYQIVNCKALNNGVEVSTAFAQINASSNTINVYRDMVPTAWTNSGTKTVIGTLIIRV